MFYHTKISMLYTGAQLNTWHVSGDNDCIRQSQCQSLKCSTLLQMFQVAALSRIMYEPKLDDSNYVGWFELYNEYKITDHLLLVL